MNAALIDANGEPVAAVNMQPNSLSSLKLYCISRDISVIRVATQSKMRLKFLCVNEGVPIFVQIR